MLLPARHDARPLLAQTVPTFSPPALLHPHTQLGRFRKESALESQERPRGRSCLCLPQVIGIIGARKGERGRDCNLWPLPVLPQPRQGLPHIRLFQSLGAQIPAGWSDG